MTRVGPKLCFTVLQIIQNKILFLSNCDQMLEEKQHKNGQEIGNDFWLEFETKHNF